MSKIICDICGTTYPDTADSCPICGCSKDAAADFLGDEFATEEIMEEPKGKAGRFTKKKEIFDFDEVNSELMDGPVEEQNPYSEEEEQEYESSGGHNVLIVVILTVLIVALLAAAGFIFIRYFLPNMKPEETVPPTTEAIIQETEAPVTTELTIPCQMLILDSGTAELSKEGQMFLLHVKPTPEDTTDAIIFASGDETVATVTDDGRITAVGEGETMIYITCGNIQTTCPVVVAYVEETVPETTAAVETTVPETQPAETTPALRTDVTLKLKQTDIRLGVYYEYQLLLDCDLEQDEVEWRSEHPHIVKVDENGVITALKDGTTSVIVKYGDQEVSCIVRCNY